MGRPCSRLASRAGTNGDITEGDFTTECTEDMKLHWGLRSGQSFSVPSVPSVPSVVKLCLVAATLLQALRGQISEFGCGLP
jgi:hypothetical protein